MEVLIPTLKFTNAIENIRYDKVYCLRMPDDTLNKLGLSVELVEMINKVNTGYSGIGRYTDPSNIRKECYDHSFHFEVIAEQHHFAGEKLRYLKQHGIACSYHGYILPINKASQFLKL